MRYTGPKTQRFPFTSAVAKAQSVGRSPSVKRGIGETKILRRLAANDRTAAQDCICVYGQFVWTMAKQFTGTQEEAENATRGIFTELWRCIGRFEKSGLDDRTFIYAVARSYLRRLSGSSGKFTQ